MTLLSSVHPYPAMVADHISTDLAEEFVAPGMRVLDPFCGTSRTLAAAAAEGAHCVGVDVNPLAVLISRVKLEPVSVTALRRALCSVPRESRVRAARSYEFVCGRKVRWFSKRVEFDLNRLVSWLNNGSFRAPELRFLAVVLSATTREVSYCRQDQWKLHRLPANLRSCHRKHTFHVFRRRLSTLIAELDKRPRNRSTSTLICGDSRRLTTCLRKAGENRKFDVLITSPPYGDSRTTVQYGGMSSIALSVVSHIDRLRLPTVLGGEIDRNCLGGQTRDEDRVNKISENLNTYWKGGRENRHRKQVLSFLADVEDCCREVSGKIRKGGSAVLIVGRRLLGSRRLLLDRFVEDSLVNGGFRLRQVRKRNIVGKLTPLKINSRGNSTSSKAGERVNTMREERVLVFEKVD